MLSMIIAPIRYNIVHDPAFGWCTSKTLCFRTSLLRKNHLEDLSVYQWGSGAFLSNSDLYIDGVDPVDGGISSLKFTNYTFQAPPEFGIYLQNQELEELALNFTQSKLLLNR